MDPSRKLAEEREQRYREAKRAKQEKEQEKRRALLRFQEDRAAQRQARELRAQGPPTAQPHHSGHPQAAASASPGAAAAEARLRSRAAQEHPLETEPNSDHQEASSPPESPLEDQDGSHLEAGKSDLRIRHVDGRIFRGNFSAATTLRELRPFVIASSMDADLHIDRILQGEAGTGVADPMQDRHGRGAGRRRSGVAFQGPAKKLGGGAEAGEEQALLEEARRAFREQTRRVVTAAMAARMGAAGGELEEGDLFFVVPFPRAEYLEEEALDISLQEAGLCPQGTLAVHVHPRPAAEGGEAAGQAAEEASRQGQAAMADVHGVGDDVMPDSAEQDEARRQVRRLALEAAARRSQQAASAEQGWHSEAQTLGTGSDERDAQEERRSQESPTEEITAAAWLGANATSEEGASDMQEMREAAQDSEQEERRRRATEALARRLGQAAVQAGATPAQNGARTEEAASKGKGPCGGGKAAVEVTPATRLGELEQRRAQVRTEAAVKAAEKERIQRMLQDDRDKRHERQARQQPAPSHSPSQPSTRGSAAGNAALNAAAAALERAAAAQRAGEQAPPPSPPPPPPLSPPAEQPARAPAGSLSSVRVRLEDGRVQTAVVPRDAPMRVVLESVLPPGADAALYGLRVPFPEQDFFDEAALGTTVEQAGLAPRGSVHLVPIASRGVLRQATAPWRQAPGWPLQGARRGAAHQAPDDDMDEDMEDSMDEDMEHDPLTGLLGGAPDLTYEQMLQMQDRIGYVRQGVPHEVISRLPTFKFQGRDTGMSGQSDEGVGQCAVCLCEFQEEDDVTTLPCLHLYHNDCISKWFRESKVCPTCKQHVS